METVLPDQKDVKRVSKTFSFSLEFIICHFCFVQIRCMDDRLFIATKLRLIFIKPKRVVVILK